MKRHVKQVALIPLLVLLLGQIAIGCAPGEEIEVTVDHYKQPCLGMAKFMCMRVDQGDGFQTFYDSINGFDFEWGHTYELLVTKEDIPNPPVDGSSVKYTLEDVLDKTPVAPGTTFPLDVEYSQPEIELSDSEGGTLLDGTPFTCDSAEICLDIEEGLASEQNFSVEFGYTTVDEILSLIAESVTL